MKLIFAEDAKRIVQNSVGWPSNKYVICEQIDALPEVQPIPVVRRTWHEPTHDREVAGIIEKAEKVKATLLNREMCPYCHSAYQYHPEGSIHGKRVAFRPTASRTDFKDWEIWQHKGETPCMMCFDRGGSGAYIDINYCPMCGRDLRNEQNDAQ